MLLKNGSTGNYVMYLQYGLHIMCCPPGSFDSKFGSGTENAVKKYQGKKGLTQDGIVGDGTWNALVSDIKTIQQLLKNKGYYASTVDGLAGSGTYNAVISFQKASGLTADGMVGSATLNALNASSGGTSGQSHSITLPTDRNYLWAQKNPDIVKLVGNSGCSLVAVLNTANIYGPREFTPNEVLTACGNWGANGLNTWALPSKCNGKMTRATTLMAVRSRRLYSVQSKQVLTITFPSLFGSTVAMAKRRILSQRLLILAVAPLQVAFPSLILLVVSFELLRKRELHAMKPYTVIISQPLVAPKYLYSLHQQ